MRQQQQRSRNRNRGRKSSNPLSRNFESNGPDVKIRGNASHIAEKYSVLARDALTSGDTVMAENYFQHAEHYFRIIAATQSNNPQATTQNNSQRENASGAVVGAVNSQSDEAENTTSGDGGNKPQPDLARDRTEGDRTKNATENANLSDKPTDSEIETQDQHNTSDEAASGNEQPEKSAPVRNRRNGRRPATTRRTSRTASEKTPRSSSKEVLSEDAPAEKLSKDAALLPSSLIGKSSENEAEAAPPASEE